MTRALDFRGWANELDARAPIYDRTRSLKLFFNRNSTLRQYLNRSHVAARFSIWQLMPQDTKQLQDQINSKTVNRDTPLMIAAERGNVDFAKTLLADPAIKVNEVDVDGNTALCRAVNAD